MEKFVMNGCYQFFADYEILFGNSMISWGNITLENVGPSVNKARNMIVEHIIKNRPELNLKRENIRIRYLNRI
jgi:hypothetical protein